MGGEVTVGMQDCVCDRGFVTRAYLSTGGLPLCAGLLDAQPESHSRALPSPQPTLPDDRVGESVHRGCASAAGSTMGFRCRESDFTSHWTGVRN